MSKQFFLVFPDSRRSVDESKGEQENGNAGFFGDDLSHFKFGDPLPLDVVRQTDLAESRKLGLDGLIEAAPAFSADLFDPLL